MTASRYLSPAENDDLHRRLRDYASTYPDSDFLDSSLAYADSGHTFTRENAAKIDDALANWQRRLNSATYNPDRAPFGYDPLIWQLATRYRQLIEDEGLHCPSRRFIYSEINRAVSRDSLREHYAPWRDEPGEPGWYRMMTRVITHFVAHEVNEHTAWYAHEDLAQPGTVARIAGYLKDQDRISRFDAHAKPENLRQPTREARGKVRDFIAARKAARGK